MVEGGLTRIGGVDFYKIDGVEAMDPFLMNVVSSTDLWMFASSRGTLTAGRTDADHAFLPYETDDRLHRSVGVSGPISVVAREIDGRREVWRPFAAEAGSGVRRSLGKSVLGDRLFMEETHVAWDVTFRATWSPAPRFGWVRTVELEAGKTDFDGEVLDGLLDVMPAGVDAVSEQLLSNLVDAYKRCETGRWGTAALYTLEALITDRAEPAESLAANLIWSIGAVDEVHLDERVVQAMIDGRPHPVESLSTGRRGAYLLRGAVGLRASESARWSLVADVALDHAAVLERIALAERPDALAVVETDIAAGNDRLGSLLAGVDGWQQTADAVADAHHLSNVMFNVMRGGLFPHARQVPVSGLAEHLELWNRDLHRRYQGALRSLGAWIDVDDLRQFAVDTGDPHLIRLVLEYLPLAFSRRHGDPSRPWNRFSISARGDDDEEVLGYEGNWRDIFQNWEALLLSHPAFLPNAVAKFVNASTVDGHNPYRISDDGIDWEVADPHDVWSNIGYWGDHQIIYLHRLLELWERTEPGAMASWLDKPIFVYADVPYVLANHTSMVRDPRNTITFDEERAGRVDARVQRLGSDGRLVVDATGSIVRVGLFEKLLVPALAKLAAFVPGGGIWMNTQRPEWNDANNALAGYGLSMVTLYHVFGYVTWLLVVLDRQGSATVPISSSVAGWVADMSEAIDRAPVAEAAADDRHRRAFMDALGAITSRYRRSASTAFDPGPVQVDAGDLRRLLEAARRHLAHSIEMAARPDGLYDSYNLVSFPSTEEARVHRLGPMLEGQVAVLSSGVLDGSESLDVVTALYASAMYREDQDSFMLYPVRSLPSFLDRNTIAADALKSAPFLSTLMGPANVLVEDSYGDLHFSPAMVNEVAVSAALADSNLDALQREHVVALYEAVFEHHAYTGRSGSMHAYEGIGSIYWHMVGKLLVAVQEAHGRAIDTGAPSGVVDGLAAAYRRIRSGLGFRKDPATFGAIPTDCYSHTPAHAGAQQPGMTGQVKEEILTRFGELGLRVANGEISMVPALLPTAELMRNGDGDGSARFSYCGVEFTIRHGAREQVRVHREGEWGPPIAGRVLDRVVSAAIFGRDGSVKRVEFTLIAEA